MCLYNSYPPQKKQRPAVIDQAVFSVLYERNLHTLWLTLLPVFIETTAISRIFECRTTGYKSVDIWKVLRPAILFKFLSDFRRSWSKFWVSTHILFDTGFFSWIFPKISVQNAAYPVFPNFFSHNAALWVQHSKFSRNSHLLSSALYSSNPLPTIFAASLPTPYLPYSLPLPEERAGTVRKRS